MGEAPTVHVPVDDAEAIAAVLTAVPWPTPSDEDATAIVNHLRSIGYRICRAEP